MGNKSTDRLDLLQRRSSRRSLLRHGAGGVAALAGAGVLAPQLGRAKQASPIAQGTPALPTFTESAKITCWGFGEEETNPVGRSRVEAFRKAYPSIDLTLVPQWDDQKLLTAAASGNVPDVLWVGRNSLATWASKNVITSLDDRLSGSTIDLSEFYDAAVKECRYQDKMYGVPQFMDVRALYVNNDALSEAGSSSDALKTGDWDQLSELGGKLVKKNGDSIERWGFDHKIQAGHLWMWGWANDGSFMNDDATKITYNDPKVVEALDWGTKVYDAQGGYQAYSGVAGTWQGDEQFARGQVAMTEYESWMLGIVARVAPDLNFTVMPILHRGGGDPVSFTGGLAWSIPTKAKEPDAAWVFIQFMSALSTWRIAAEATQQYRKQNNSVYIPSLTANRVADQMQIDDFYQPIAPQFDAAVKLFPKILETSRNLPLSASPVGNQLNDLLVDASKKALGKEESAQDALDEATQKAQDAVDEANG